MHVVEIFTVYKSIKQKIKTWNSGAKPRPTGCCGVVRISSLIDFVKIIPQLKSHCNIFTYQRYSKL